MCIRDSGERDERHALVLGQLRRGHVAAGCELPHEGGDGGWVAADALGQLAHGQLAVCEQLHEDVAVRGRDAREAVLLELLQEESVRQAERPGQLVDGSAQAGLLSMRRMLGDYTLTSK